MLDVNDVRRKTADLIPRNDIVRSACDNSFCSAAGQNIASHIAKTYAMTVAENSSFHRQMRTNRCQSFVAPHRRRAIRFAEQCSFKLNISTPPLSDLDARA